MTKSVTDPDSGLFVKGSHQQMLAYEAHTACDENGFVLATVVTPGNVHDSVAFDEVYDQVTEAFPDVESVVADSAYKTPHICKKVFDDGRVLSTSYKRPKETIERVFADAKEKHAMRYTQYRGLAQVTKWVKLKFVAMNLGAGFAIPTFSKNRLLFTQNAPLSAKRERAAVVSLCNTPFFCPYITTK